MLDADRSLHARQQAVLEKGFWQGEPDLTHLAPAPEALVKILKRHRDEEGSLVPVLQEIQRHFGYISREHMAYVARELRRPMSEVFGVASFYAQFYLEPRGENMVRVCLGTACHVRGGQEILAAFAHVLGIQPGDTTSDNKFSLERVACLGACGLAPVAMINQEMFGRLTPEKVANLVTNLKEEREVLGTGERH